MDNFRAAVQSEINRLMRMIRHPLYFKLKERRNKKKEQLISQIMPLLNTFIIGVFAVIVKDIRDAIITLVQTKKEEVSGRFCKVSMIRKLKQTLEVWNIVDEHFRVSKAVGDTIKSLVLFYFLKDICFNCRIVITWKGR